MSFAGFPGLARGTVVPNQYFAELLPRVSTPAELLAFLWTSYLVQQQRGEARFVTADDIWSVPGAAESFAQLGGGRAGLEAALQGCAERGELLELTLHGNSPGDDRTIYFVNNAGSRRAVARARTGELALVPGTTVALPAPEPRPGIFRLYEENIGTITPLVGERLLHAAENYPWEWIHEAFRQAAERNVRNWRYIERVLKGWAEEGRVHATTGHDSLEERKQRYTGGRFGNVVRYRRGR